MKSYLDWSAYENAGMGDAYADIPKTGGDFAKAVAVCINSRQCESMDKGVMCPSYRVSRDAGLSTGGRVRLLKQALNGELGSTPFVDKQLIEVMDRCVSCKGCRRECENNVDMALLKVEYLAQRNARLGVPLRARLIANLPTLLHRRRWLRHLIVWRNRIPALAILTQWLLGISAARRLPEPVDIPFQAPVGAPDEQAPDPRVVLFIDSFTRQFRPSIATSAIRVLTEAGYEVIVASADDDEERPLCCGRTLIAHGLVEQARAEAKRTVSALRPHVEAGLPVIGLEPTCLINFREEYLALGLGVIAEQLAGQALMFEEFLSRELRAKRLTLPLQPIASLNGPVLVHGHCHQKAVGAMKAMRRVLKLIPDLTFEIIESSCCGGAGGYNLEQEHSDDAMAMGEQALFPALRQQPDATVVANGFSCRHQIEEGTARSSLHLAELLEAALINNPVSSA